MARSAGNDRLIYHGRSNDRMSGGCCVLCCGAVVCSCCVAAMCGVVGVVAASNSGTTQWLSGSGRERTT